MSSTATAVLTPQQIASQRLLAISQVRGSSRRAEMASSARNNSKLLLLSILPMVALIIFNLVSVVLITPYYIALFVAALALIYCEFSPQVGRFWHAVAAVLAPTAAAVAITCLVLGFIALGRTVACFTSGDLQCVEADGLATLGSTIILFITGFLVFSIYTSIQAIEMAYEDEISQIYAVISDPSFATVPIK